MKNLNKYMEMARRSAKMAEYLKDNFDDKQLPFISNLCNKLKGGRT